MCATHHCENQHIYFTDLPFSSAFSPSSKLVDVLEEREQYELLENEQDMGKVGVNETRSFPMSYMDLNPAGETESELGQIEDLLAESAAMKKLFKDLRQRTQKRLDEILKIKLSRMKRIDKVNEVIQSDDDTTSITTIPSDARV
ncbi:hypothetical protein M422DRAFT_52183 [Sphaerobolus stellatus SS14]|uniref:Uncharacterized protein n=1 Tax=Sphaerobolus stellatus (strain SS14) TaxID=990650 RepID=A0A0C9TUS2_SPHS4|nr:hypothetical protein M422DRAFT_52183 [Sphaerobolus stellatus SS14]